VFPPTGPNGKVVTKKVENDLRKNEVNLPNHIHMMRQVDYTFSGGILTQTVFGGETGHGGKIFSISICSWLHSMNPHLQQ